MNRDGGRFIDNHQIFVNMKDLHWCVQHLCDNHPILYTHLQWNPSNTDTNAAEESERYPS